MSGVRRQVPNTRCQVSGSRNGSGAQGTANAPGAAEWVLSCFRAALEGGTRRSGRTYVSFTEGTVREFRRGRGARIKKILQAKPLNV